MRSFCVECGREAEVYQGLCEDCLPKKRSFLEVPLVLDLSQCNHCGAFRLPGGWRETALEEALRDLISASSKVPREVLHHHINVAHAPEDGRSLQVEVSARIHLEGMAVTEERRLRVRVKGATCPSCSRQRGQYYEAIIQLRAEGRPVGERELRLARRLIRDRVRSTQGLFITREEAVHGGLDVYLSSSEAAKSIVQALKASLGGEVSASPKLHTRRQGRNVYRVTYRLRLPAYAAGDVVGVEGGLYRILSSGDVTSVLDLRRGETRTLRSKDLKKAVRVDAKVVQGIVVSEDAEEVQVMDPDSYEVQALPRPPGLEVKEGKVTLVVTDSGTFIVPTEGGEE
jgi:nonsense-mediated mRNA decay protein 3